MMFHATSALAELDAVDRTGRQNGSRDAGEIWLGVALPPNGKLLADWARKVSERDAYRLGDKRPTQ
jgi:hypothetical protein